MFFISNLQKVLPALLLLAAATQAVAGPYSGALADPSNTFDAGIAGFVGPAGEGVVDPNNSINPIFRAWASGYLNYLPADPNYMLPQWMVPIKALDEVTGNVPQWDIVSLGDLFEDQIAEGLTPGQITLSFAKPIFDGAGKDFAVFENALISDSQGGGAEVGKVFAELGYVEVSTDGTNFARFPSHSLTAQPAVPGNAGYFTVDPTEVYNLAGKHVNADGESWGTPFDLAELAADPLVLSGEIDLREINYVRIVDIPGSGDFLDSFGNPIYDAWPTWESGGLDLEAVGVIHEKIFGDINLDDVLDTGDIDAIFDAISAGTTDTFFDLTGEGDIDQADAEMLIQNILFTNYGDANFDWAVDVTDLNLWKANRFQSGMNWARGDFNGYGATDVGDLNLWKAYRFQFFGPPAAMTLPEPTTIILLGAAAPLMLRKRKS